MKRLFSWILCLALLAAMVVPALGDYTVRMSTWSLMVDGDMVSCLKYNINGYNYFKLRDLAYLLNGTPCQFSVDYIEETNTVSIVTGQPYEPIGTELMEPAEDELVTVELSSHGLQIDGERARGFSYYLINGNNYYKLRDLAEYVGFDVDSSNVSRTAIINTAPHVRRELNPEEIYARCTPAVFYLELYDSDGWAIKSGSGFFVSESGVAVTNFHVISGAADASVVLSDGRECRVSGVYNWNEEEDWAVIQVEGSGFSALTVGSESSAVGGAKAYAIGSPLGLQNTMTDGMISNPSRMDGNVRYLQTSAAISHGSSGGALINKYGEVIGVTSAGYEEGQNLNLALPMSYVNYTDLGELTPLSSAARVEYGMIYIEEAEILLSMSDDAYVIHAYVDVESDADYYLQYSFQDPEIVDAEWGDWYNDAHSIDLTLWPREVGTSALTVWLYTTEGTLLDAKFMSVTVLPSESTPTGGGTLNILGSDSVTVPLNGSERRTIYAFPGETDEVCYLKYMIDDPNIVSCSWAEEWDDYYYLDLFIFPQTTGTTNITLVYYTESNVTLATRTMQVTVVPGV